MQAYLSRIDLGEDENHGPYRNIIILFTTFPGILRDVFGRQASIANHAPVTPPLRRRGRDAGRAGRRPLRRDEHFGDIAPGAIGIAPRASGLDRRDEVVR